MATDQAKAMGSSITNVSKKVYNVMKKIGKLKKSGRNDYFGYDYVTEEDVLTEVRQHLIDEKLIIVPSLDSERVEGARTILNIKFNIIDIETGEILALIFQGQGADEKDKGGYKAMTGALKYFLTKTFMIPTNDDPERDHVSNVKPAKTYSAPAVETPEQRIDRELNAPSPDRPAGGPPASPAQKNLMRRLQGEGKIAANVDIENLSLVEAKSVITKGLQGGGRAY